MKTGTIRRIGILLVAVGVISWGVWIFFTWFFEGPFSIGSFEFEYIRCHLDQSAGCQAIAKAPEYGLILIAIGALLYTSARTKKAGVVGKEAGSQVPPSPRSDSIHSAEGAGEVLSQINNS